MDSELVRRVADLLDEIDGALDRGEDAGLLLGEFQGLTGRRWQAADIRGFWRAMSAEDLAMQALARPPLDRDSLTLVRGLLDGEFPFHETPDVIDELARRTGDPGFSDLIYWPEREGVTAEAILHLAEERGRGVVLAPTPFLEWLADHLDELPADLAFPVRQRLKLRREAPEGHEEAARWVEQALAPAKAGYVRRAYEKWKGLY